MSLYRVYVLSVVLAIIGAAWAAQPSVAELLATSPGQTFEQDKALCETLLKQGPEAIRALCDLVQPSGDDGRVRTVLMDLAVTVGKGAPQQREMFSKTICEVLQSNADKEIKALYIQLLQYAGGDEAVGTLAEYLNDARLSSPAATALIQIGTETACNALLDSLARQDTVAKTDVIIGLGSLRVQKASGAIAALLDNPPLRESARWALANIGDEAAVELIESDWKKAAGYAKSVAGDDYLLLAERLVEKGQKDKALAICKQFGVEAPIHQQIKVLAILVSVQGEQTMTELLAAADSDNAELQAAAVKMGGAIRGAKVTIQWVDKLQKANPTLAARILGMLGDRGDQSAWEAVVKAFGHADGQVVIAAMEAAVKLRPGEAVEPILAVLRQNAQPEIIAAGRDILMRLPSDKPLLAAAEALKTMPQASRIALIEGLAGRAAMCCSARPAGSGSEADGPIRLAGDEGILSDDGRGRGICRGD
jgi:HEAT repeat protein